MGMNHGDTESTKKKPKREAVRLDQSALCGVSSRATSLAVGDFPDRQRLFLAVRRLFGLVSVFSVPQWYTPMLAG
jgi:hypothetical protein